MKIAVILPTLAGGGMERMRLNMINVWIREGIDIDIVVCRKEGALLKLVPSGINVYEVAAASPLLFPFGLWRYIKSQQPSHLLSAGTDINALTLLTARLFKIHLPLVVSFHIHLSKEIYHQHGLKKIKARLIAWLLRMAVGKDTRIVTVSRGISEDFIRVLNISPDKLQVIYNPIITPDFQALSRKPLKDCPAQVRPWIIFVGRLTPQKDLNTLIDAFQLLLQQMRAELIIVGDGPLKDQIMQRISDNGLSDVIHLTGFINNPLPYIRAADILVLSSLYEGLGNVLVESMACGTQVIATDCPSGPAEILDNGRYGQLVPVKDPAALCNAMVDCLQGTYHVSSQELENRANDFTVERAATLYKNMLLGTN